VSTHVATIAYTPTTFTIEANGQLVSTLNLPALATNGSDLAKEQTVTNTTTVPSGTISIKVSYNNNGVPNSKGYLDYIIINAKSTLKGNGKQYRFQYDDASTLPGVGEYQLSNATAVTQVWDITDLYNVTKATNPGQSNLRSKQSSANSEIYCSRPK